MYDPTDPHMADSFAARAAAFYARQRTTPPPPPPRPQRKRPDVSPEGMGTAAFVFALLGLIIPPFGLPAVGLGLATNHALRKAGRYPAGLATAAWIIGLVGTAVTVALAVLAFSPRPYI